MNTKDIDFLNCPNTVNKSLRKIGIKTQYKDGSYKSLNTVMDEIAEQWNAGFWKRLVRRVKSIFTQ